MKVGYRTGRFEDPARPNWDGNGPRPLAWTAWYPASDDAITHERLLGPRSAPTYSIGPMAANAALRATPQRLPLVLLSHGTGGSALGLGWLGRRLAQYGFMAIGVAHHGNTLNEPYRAEGFLCWWERPRDLSVLLDRMVSHSEFADRIDVNRVFAAGYSLGGCAVASLLGAITETSRFQRSAANPNPARGVPEFPDLADHLPGLLESSAVFRESWARMSNDYRDPRLKAALLLAPGRGLLGFNAASLTVIDTPARIIVGGADPALPAARWLHPRLRASVLDVLPADVGHYIFLPEATDAGRRDSPPNCVDAPGVDRAAIHQHAADAAVALFEAMPTVAPDK
ncbi:alpha/beta hydrolase family protein [Rhodopseudomonas sp. P2A-2r]|uniref:alpha/beta hydrolase family protein n=1 Tax=unclassified Rhodopseudomonas TaxID=2638247 RepID=UPI0022348E0B|nr:signal peptidase [Rhodopseudomonas sp. P2A-2r]UZE50432.1 signal peptidase [Rhodopseudomonas sp. P2A-2r]